MLLLRFLLQSNFQILGLVSLMLDACLIKAVCVQGLGFFHRYPYRANVAIK